MHERINEINVRMGLVSKHLNEWDVTHKKKKKRN
jgi:hypothetical protein